MIWYDPRMTTRSKEKLENALEIDINVYKDFDKLWQRIHNDSNIPYHLICSGKDEAEKIVKDLENFQNLLGLYIYNDSFQMDQISQNDKVEVQRNLDKLIPRIKEGIRTRSKLKDTFPAFATNFDDFDKSHLYNVRHYLKGLINFKNRYQAREDFLKLAKKIYQDKNKDMMKFEHNYHQYQREQILHWYTKDSPIYRLVNNCLRISSPDSILYCRFILKDMENAIKEEYQRKGKDLNGVVYRGAYVSEDEWKKLQNNISQEIEMYGFLSTTVNQRTAINFVRGDLKNKIFITIIVPPLPAEADEQGFADVSQFSEFKGEKEILFNVRSRFRILTAQVSKIDNKGTTCRHLVLLYGAQSLKRFMTKHQPSIKVELTLPAGVECRLCRSEEKLFGFNIKGTTEVCCIHCLHKDSIPKNIPLLALDLQKGTLSKTLKAKLLTFNEPINLSYYGYRCHNCHKEAGKMKYYKWISSDGKSFEQCLECFDKNRKIESDILFSEEHPYVLWQEQQTKWEEAESHYQIEDSEFLQNEFQGDVYLETQDFDLCIDYEEQVISKLCRTRGKEREQIQHLNVLITAHEKLGNNQEALEYGKTVLHLCKIIYSEKHQNTATSYSALADLYESLGEHQKALKYHSKALEIRKEVYGEKHPLVSNSYSNIGFVYESLGEYKKALKENMKALELEKTIYGENHPEIASLYGNIASVYANLGQHQQAFSFYEKALDIKRAVFGEKHPDVATSYNNLGGIFLAQENLKQALEYYNKALNLKKSIYQENHLEIAISYNSLGSVYESLGEYKRAKEYYLQALNIVKEISGENSLDTAFTYKNLGSVYEELGKYEEAFEFYKRALDIERIAYGEKHPQIATSYNKFGSVYGNLGEYEKAFEYYQKALDLAKATYGEKHPVIATSYTNIGSVYENLGKKKKALEYYEKALEMRNVNYGENHPITACSYNNLGSVYESLEETQKALEYYNKALNIYKGAYEEKHPDIAESYRGLAFVYKRLKEYQQALDYHNKSLDISKALYGEKHPKIALSYNNIASLNESLGEYQQALEFHQKALDIWKDVYGEKHPHITISENNIASVYEKLRESQQTQEDHKKGKDINKKPIGSFDKDFSLANRMT